MILRSPPCFAWATLHARDHAALTTNIGLALAVDATRWLAARGLAKSAAFRDFAPRTDTALRATRAELRCAIERAKHVLGVSGVPSERVLGALDGFLGTKRDLARLEQARRDVQLPTEQGWLDRELPDYEAFWQETDTRARSARSSDDMVGVLHERAAAARAHPTSLLVRTVGEVVFSERANKALGEIQGQVADYQEAISP